MKFLFMFLSQASCLFLILVFKFSRNIALSFVKKLLRTSVVVGFCVEMLGIGGHSVPAVLYSYDVVAQGVP